MRVGVVINPMSGARGRRGDEASARVALARRVVEAVGADAEVAVTERRGHGAELAAGFVARGAKTVIAWGGDGTVNEVAGPLIGSLTALGVVPSGSGDGLARGLALPLEATRALEVAIGGHAEPIDVGFLGSRHFLNVAGIGFDAVVGAEFNRLGKRGGLRYVSHVLSLVWGYRSRTYHIEFDGTVLTGERFLIGFANGREYGNRLVLDHHADPRDACLNLVVVDSGPPIVQLWRARRLAIRPHRPAWGVYRTRARSARVSGDDLRCHVDGETFETSGTLDVTVRAGGIRIVTGDKRSPR